MAKWNASYSLVPRGPRAKLSAAITRTRLNRQRGKKTYEAGEQAVQNTESFPGEPAHKEKQKMLGAGPGAFIAGELLLNDPAVSSWLPS